MTTKIKYHTKEKALKAIKKDPLNLEYCSPGMKNNEEVVTAAINREIWLFSYASTTLKSKKEFILKMMNDCSLPYWTMLVYANPAILEDIEVMSLAIEKDPTGFIFYLASGEAGMNTELAAKALVKWGISRQADDFQLWEDLHPTLQEFFPKDSFYEKAQAYLYQLEQEQQAEVVSGGSTTEDGVVW